MIVKEIRDVERREIPTQSLEHDRQSGQHLPNLLTLQLPTPTRTLPTPVLQSPKRKSVTFRALLGRPVGWPKSDSRTNSVNCPLNAANSRRHRELPSNRSKRRAAKKGSSHEDLQQTSTATATSTTALTHTTERRLRHDSITVLRWLGLTTAIEYFVNYLAHAHYTLVGG